MNEVTRILKSTVGDDGNIAAELLPLVYDELRNLARAKMSREAPGQTLQATALVHEAYLRLAGNDQQAWANRAHFFSAAAEAMRRILIDRARKRCALKRGEGKEHVDLDDLQLAAPGPDNEMLGVNEALAKLAAHDPTKAELVKLKYFAGLTTEEAAALLGISEPTAKRYWAYARAWLFRELTREM